MILSFECSEPEGKIIREVRPAELSFAKLTGYYDKLKQFDTVFNSYIANNLDDFIRLFVMGDGDHGVRATGLIWEVDDVGILYLTEIAIGHDALAHLNFWDRRLRGREHLVRGMMKHIMEFLDLHRISVEVGMFAAPWLPIAIERIGFIREGRKREALKYKGEWFDCIMYSMLRSEVEKSWHQRDKKSVVKQLR